MTDYYDESSLLPQKGQTQSAQSELRLLPWSHYERLIRVEDKKAREWYAKEAFNENQSNRFRNTYYNQSFELGFRQVRKAYNLNVGIWSTILIPNYANVM